MASFITANMLCILQCGSNTRD